MVVATAVIHPNQQEWESSLIVIKHIFYWKLYFIEAFYWLFSFFSLKLQAESIFVLSSEIPYANYLNLNQQSS